MKAILTKYFGPGNSKGTRIKAWELDGHCVFYSYNYALSSEANHRSAAEKLRDKMGWSGELVAGGTKDGYAFVFTGL